MEQTINRIALENFKEAARLIASLNRQPEHHIGFCGTNEEEIFKTLEEDFLEGGESSLVGVWGKDGLEALIGLDIDEDSAEVWGPFSKPDAFGHQLSLWKKLKRLYPEVSRYSFFINEQNRRQLAFMEEIGARKTGEHLLLEVSRETFTPVEEVTNRLYEQTDFAQFEHLHNTAFPGTYYDAATIARRVRGDQAHVLKVAGASETVSAYAYYEIDVISGEAHLEYLAVDPETRGQGIGTLLLKEILTEIFQYDGIDELILSVDNDNTHANHVYFKAGFREKAKLWSYRSEHKKG